jgi:hypothetical protein
MIFQGSKARQKSTRVSVTVSKGAGSEHQSQISPLQIIAIRDMSSTDQQGSGREIWYVSPGRPHAGFHVVTQLTRNNAFMLITNAQMNHFCQPCATRSSVTANDAFDSPRAILYT